MHEHRWSEWEIKPLENFPDYQFIGVKQVEDIDPSTFKKCECLDCGRISVQVSDINVYYDRYPWNRPKAEDAQIYQGHRTPSVAEIIGRFHKSEEKN